VKDTTENKPAGHLLVERVLSGDTNAFAIIIADTERLVAQIVFRMVPNAGDRRDIAQDIYLKAFQKLGTFKFQSKLSTWIAHIAYNTCCNHLEKKKLVLVNDLFKDDETDDEQMAYIGINPNEAAHNDTESFLFKNELALILRTETDKLSPLYKTLITLFHTEELSYEEIGAITGLPEGTIKNYLFRARKTLKINLLKTYKREEL
jgi:RNA polymerase sigma factor (sigma-70 family)